MSFIRTILGDIPPSEFGICMAHEHLIIDGSYTTVVNPGFLLDSVEKCVEELERYHEDGGRAMVDSMPCDCGRNAIKLAEISRRTGVHIICPTGLHLGKYYPPGHWGHVYSREQLEELFVLEIESGIDRNDYGGPIVERLSHRAGILKVASGQDRISAHEHRIFEAAAGAHRRTGCPILTHTEAGTAAMEQVELLQSEGVDLRHVILSHLDRKPNEEDHRRVLRTGVRLEYDSAFRWKSGQGNPTLELLARLAPEFPRQILLGMDAARSAYWKSYGGGPGLSFLLREFRPAMQAAGLSNALIQRIFVENPAESLSFREEKGIRSLQGDCLRLLKSC